MPSEVYSQSQSPSPSPSALNKPFVIEVRQESSRHGSFTPAASLKITEHLRTSGLLSVLSPEDLKNLLYLLTFLSPDGQCQASLPILAAAMNTSAQKTKSRMHRLAQAKWQDEPIVIEVAHENGLFTYSPHPLLLAYEHLTLSQPPAALSLSLPGSSREKVIAYSRAHYTRPRAEVEKIIAQQLGHDPDESEEDEEQTKLRTRLEIAGLTREQAREVMGMYAPEIIAQQLDWLPYRQAKNPAGYLLAAIEGNYGEPRALRNERLLRELKYQEQLLREEQMQQQQDQLQQSQEPPSAERTEPAQAVSELAEATSTERVEEPASEPTDTADIADIADLGQDESVRLTPGQ